MEARPGRHFNYFSKKFQLIKNYNENSDFFFSDGSSRVVALDGRLYFVYPGHYLDGVKDGGLVTLGPGDDFSLSGLHGNCAFALAVHVEQLAEIETGALQDLDFVDEDIVERVDGLASLLDVFSDGVRDQLVDSFLQVGRTNLFGDDLHHLTANVLDLLRLGIRSLLDLVLPFFGEANAEEAQSVTVARLHVHASLDHRLPFLHHRSGFIGGEVHSVEVGEAITPLNILADETEFVESDFVILQISQRHLVNAALQTVRCDASSRSLVDGVLQMPLVLNMTGALTSYHSLRVKGSTIFFFWPFLPPFVKRLFFPTAIFT